MPDDSTNIKICWWNVNRRLTEIVKNISPITDLPDILFVTETSIPYGELPNIEKYKKFADKKCCTNGCPWKCWCPCECRCLHISFSCRYNTSEFDETAHAGALRYELYEIHLIKSC